MFANALTIVFVAAGIFFFVVGTVGLLRLPDSYTRMHATTKCDTLGIGLTLVGLGIHAGISFETVKLLLIILFVWITNPTATHVIARATYHSRDRLGHGVDYDD
ncbi:MAG: monovalent cation/H(+) antiporter subunit G [Bacillota bacterium]